MMGLNQTNCCLIFVLCLSLLTAPSTSTSISDSVFGSPFLSERRLLQAEKPCPVPFEFQNYTIITSQCKGPNYSPEPCCSALKEFACPFADELNDLSNNCAKTMFGYITTIGKYPNGLFASLCKDNKEGLVCPPEPPSSQASVKDNENSGSRIICRRVFMITVAALAICMNFACLW